MSTEMNELLLFYRFQIDLDFHIIANHHATSLQRYVPSQTKILAVYCGYCRETSALETKGIFGNLASIVSVENNLFGHAVHCQVTKYLILIISLWFYFLAFERDNRVVLSIKEVSRTQVSVAALIAGIDAAGLSFSLYPGILRMLLVNLELALENVKASRDFADHHVFDRESYLRV